MKMLFIAEPHSTLSFPFVLNILFFTVGIFRCLPLSLPPSFFLNYLFLFLPLSLSPFRFLCILLITPDPSIVV